jgi:hypothetical protein
VIAWHLYVPDDTSEPVAVAGDGYLDELASRLSMRRTQTLASRQLPRSQPDRWQTSRHVRHDQPRAEGISR